MISNPDPGPQNDVLLQFATICSSLQGDYTKQIVKPLQKCHLSKLQNFDATSHQIEQLPKTGFEMLLQAAAYLDQDSSLLELPITRCEVNSVRKQIAGKLPIFPMAI